MAGAWEALVGAADWISAMLGIAAAVALAWPMFGEVGDRQRYDALTRLLRDARGDEAMEEVRRQMIDERLGGYASLISKVRVGAFLLLLSFAFALLYALTKSD